MMDIFVHYARNEQALVELPYHACETFLLFSPLQTRDEEIRTQAYTACLQQPTTTVEECQRVANKAVKKQHRTAATKPAAIP